MDFYVIMGSDNNIIAYSFYKDHIMFYLKDRGLEKNKDIKIIKLSEETNLELVNDIQRKQEENQLIELDNIIVTQSEEEYFISSLYNFMDELKKAILNINNSSNYIKLSSDEEKKLKLFFGLLYSKVSSYFRGYENEDEYEDDENEYMENLDMYTIFHDVLL